MNYLKFNLNRFNFNKFIKISNYNYIMDNRYWSNGCPALMQDGRFITNHVRSAVYDQFVKNVNDIQSAHDYRLYLQQHGDEILNKERSFMIKNNTCDVNGKCLPLSGKNSQNVIPCGTCYEQK